MANSRFVNRLAVSAFIVSFKYLVFCVFKRFPLSKEQKIPYALDYKDIKVFFIQKDFVKKNAVQGSVGHLSNNSKERAS